MKRFWREVTVDEDRAIRLDERPVRTPGRLPLQLPTTALAEAVADEWRAVADTIDPRLMPLTGLANAAIDRIGPDPATFAAGLAGYADSDLLYYRAEAASPLAGRQQALWGPVIDWARRRYDVHFHLVEGVVHRAQPDETLARLSDATAAWSPFGLAALSPIVTLTGSLLLALALAEAAVDPEGIWAAAHVDEDWQAELWGKDSLATAARADRRRAFDAAVRFLQLLDDPPAANTAVDQGA